MDGEGDDRYTALETTFSKSYSNGWSLLGSYSIDRRDARNIDPRNPNEALYGIVVNKSASGRCRKPTRGFG